MHSCFSDKIDGRCPCTVWGYLLLQGTLDALGFWNMVCGKYNTDELYVVKDWTGVDRDQ